jgi:probable HAF family extracellular repeat protein
MVREPNLAMTTHGVLWQNGAFVQDLGAMAGFQSTNPQDINDLGQVVGISTSTTNFNSTAFSWQNGSFTNLGALVAGAASSATAVNNTGTVVGTSNGGFPVRWVNGAIQSLPVPAGVIQPQPVDVNDAGDIIGWGTSSAAGVLYASAFWRNGVGYLLPAWPGATQTMARSINNNGEIVGEGPLVPGGPMHALLWKVTTGSPPPPPPVGNTAPNATLVATTSTRIRAGGKVTMRGSFTDPDNGPWSYQFVWGNGTSVRDQDDGRDDHRHPQVHQARHLHGPDAGDRRTGRRGHQQCGDGHGSVVAGGGLTGRTGAAGVVQPAAP